MEQKSKLFQTTMSTLPENLRNPLHYDSPLLGFLPRKEGVLGLPGCSSYGLVPVKLPRSGEVQILAQQSTELPRAS